LATVTKQKCAEVDEMIRREQGIQATTTVTHRDRVICHNQTLKPEDNAAIDGCR